MIASVSDVKLYMECPQKWYYQCVEKRVAPTKSKALLTGTALHKMMENKLRGKDPLFGVHDDWGPTEESFELLPLVHAFKLPDNLEIAPHHHQYRIERALKFKLGRHTVYCRLDAIPLDTMLSKSWSMQYKTLGPGKTAATLIESLQFGWHEPIYHHAMKENSYNPLGTIVVVFRKLGKTITENGKRREITDAERIEKGLLTYNFPYDPKITAERLADLERILDEMDAAKKMVRNYDSCFGAFGNSKCPYFEVCHHGEKIENFTQLETRYPEFPEEELVPAPLENPYRYLKAKPWKTDQPITIDYHKAELYLQRLIDEERKQLDQLIEPTTYTQKKRVVK